MRTSLAIVVVTAVLAAGLPALAEGTPPPAFGGSYFGVNAGIARGSSDYTTSPGCPPSATDAVFCNAPPDASAANGTAVAASGSGDLSSTEFTGGIQVGYNWQRGNFIFGGEGDFGALNLSQSASTTGVFPFPFLGTTYALLDRMSTSWLATVRGRLGYTVTPGLLLYATGGVAFADFKFSSSYSDNAIDATFPGGNGFGSKSEVRAGWVVGGGGEWLLGGPWSIKAEYLYLDFGSMSVAVPISNTPVFAQQMQVKADLSAHVARVGINYHY
jgi:outer membrane immunogenic protein